MTARTPAPGSQIDAIRKRLADFYEPDDAEQFLEAEQALLDGRRPIDLINGGEADKVFELLDMMDSGVYL